MASYDDKPLDGAGLAHLWAKLKAAFAPLTHGHSASDITSGTLPIGRGGTGASTAQDALNNLFEDIISDYGVIGYTANNNIEVMTQVPVSMGGTGAGNAANARTNLGAQETLVSGTNIKTINGNSLLGSGNIAISGGGTVDTAINGTSTNPVENRAIASALNGKLNVADFLTKLNAEAMTMAETAGDYGFLWFPESSEAVEVIPSADVCDEIGAAAASHTHDAGDITSGTLAAARIPQLAQTKVTPIYYEAHGSGDKTLNAGTITQVTLVTTGALSSGSGLAIASGGIKITNAGRYRITGSAYINSPTGTTAKGVYIYRATGSGAFSAASELFSAYYESGPLNAAVGCGPKIVQCAANDIIYLAARNRGVAGTCDQDNASTYLLVERLS